MSEREHEDALDREQPEAVLRDDEPGRQPASSRWTTDQVGEEPRAEAHTGISYFSNRRYSAARLRPSACATFEMLPS